MKKIISVKNKQQLNKQFLIDIDLKQFETFCEKTALALQAKKDISVDKLLKNAVAEIVKHTKTAGEDGKKLFPLRPNFPAGISYSKKDLLRLKRDFLNKTGQYLSSLANKFLKRSCDVEKLNKLMVILGLCLFRTMVEDSVEIVAHGTDNHSLLTKELLPDSINKLGFPIKQSFQQATGLDGELAQDIVNLAIVLHDVGYQNCCHGKVHHSLDGAILYTQLIEPELLSVLQSIDLTEHQAKQTSKLIKDAILYHNADKVSSGLNVKVELESNVGTLYSERKLTALQKTFLSLRGVRIASEKEFGQLSGAHQGRSVKFKLPILTPHNVKSDLARLSLALPVFQTSLYPSQEDDFKRFGEFCLAVTKLLDNIQFINRKHLFHEFKDFDVMLKKYVGILKADKTTQEKESLRQKLILSYQADIDRIKLILKENPTSDNKQLISKKLHQKQIVLNLFKNHIHLDQSPYFLGMNPFDSVKVSIKSDKNGDSVIQIMCKQNKLFDEFNQINIKEDGHTVTLAELYPFRIYLAMKKVLTPIEIWYQPKNQEPYLYRSNLS